ncbi:MAG TPA: chemotaxis protein CheC [Chloroflexota bacterium]|nr:chemotaxis protein CheC [Chloroflexota bacterium]
MTVLSGLNIGESQWIVLREVAEKGAANAAAGLSSTLGRNIVIHASDVALRPIASVPSILGDPDDVVVGVYMAMGGDVKGHLLLLFSPAEAMGLVDMLMDMPRGTTKTLGPMERSALGEVGNLAGTFFVNALADMTHFGIQPSPPAVMVDMGAAVLDAPLVLLAQAAEEALVINTLFVDNRRQIDAALLVMPDLPSLRAIVEVVERRWRSK